MADKTADELEQERLEKEKAEKKKVKFDEDQTRFVNSLYNQAFGEGATKERTEWQKKLDDQKAAHEKLIADERAAWEAKVAEAAKTGAKKTPEPEVPPTVKATEIKIEDHPALKSLKAQFEEMNKIFTNVKQERDSLKAETEKAKVERRKSRKKDAFLSATTEAKISFFDVQEAYGLAEQEGLEYDDENDRVWVKNSATGAAKLNENGEPMTAVDYVKEFAARKKYLVKAADSTGGVGSTQAERLKEDPPSVKDYSKLTIEEFEAERQRVLSKPRE